MSLHTYWLINGVSSKPIQTLSTDNSIADALQKCDLEIACEFKNDSKYMVLSTNNGVEQIQLYNVVSSELRYCAPHYGKLNPIRRTENGKWDFVDLLKVYNARHEHAPVYLHISTTSREFGHTLKFTYDDVIKDADEMNDFFNRQFEHYTFFMTVNLTQRHPIKTFRLPTELVKVYDSHN